MSRRRPLGGAARCLAATLGLALAAAGARAQTAAPPPGPEVTPALVRSKELMVQRLLTDSPAVQRIVNSENKEARELFQAAQGQYNGAAAAMKAGDLARANELLNEAMWTLGRARQLVPDDMNRKIEQRVRYGRLMASTEALRSSYRRHLARAKGVPAGTVPASDELERIQSWMDEARAYADSEQLTEAIRSLEKAEQGLMAGLNSVLGSATLEYAHRFETQAEEFAWELDRNRSYGELVPLALGELKPTDDARRLVERYVEQSAALRSQAEQDAGRKDWDKALKAIRNGTSYLQRALLAAGLVVPQE